MGEAIPRASKKAAAEFGNLQDCADYADLNHSVWTGITPSRPLSTLPRCCCRAAAAAALAASSGGSPPLNLPENSL